MTELEKMLKDTLTRIEQDFSRSLAAQGKILDDQQRALTAHGQSLRQLQEAISQGKTEAQSLTKRLEDLAGLYKRLELLLSRLNSSILNGR